MDALVQAGHIVVPIGITPDGHWLTRGEPLAELSQIAGSGQRPAAQATEELSSRASADCGGSWGLLPQDHPLEPLPAVDIVFPVLHGTYGEDGTVQGLLEMANMPYVGCGVLASALAMDKEVSRRLFAQAGLPQVDFRSVLRNQWQQAPEETIDDLVSELDLPLFVKPANLGSSVGISKVLSVGELSGAIQLACLYDRKIVVEAAVPNAREIEVSVLGDTRPVASVPGEVVPGNEFYDYAAKYLDDNSELLIPAPLEPKMTATVQEMAVAAFKAVDGAGLARVDFLLDDAHDRLYLNELNTMPGFTRISMYPKLWEASDISYPALVDRLLHLGMERYQERLANRTSYDLF
jgi:D-alanine-D-alanine ligase